MHDLQLRDFGTLNVLPTTVVSFLSSHKHLQQATELLFFRAFSYISICHANDNVLFHSQSTLSSRILHGFTCRHFSSMRKVHLFVLQILIGVELYHDK